jgi:hypothetical protein
MGDSLSAGQKELYTALFENYAAYFAFTDHEIGRLLDTVKKVPDADRGNPVTPGQAWRTGNRTALSGRLCLGRQHTPPMG